MQTRLLISKFLELRKGRASGAMTKAKGGRKTRLRKRAGHNVLSRPFSCPEPPRTLDALLSRA